MLTPATDSRVPTPSLASVITPPSFPHATHSLIRSMLVESITLDADLQPRARIDDDTWWDYAEALTAGAIFPPVTVFLDGATYWLADGYHRWHAHRALGFLQITVEVHQGSKQDALRHSLAANAQHGKQRGQSDYSKAYDIACRNGLVEPHDADGLRDLLDCSLRWARELTKAAREQKVLHQAAAIAAGKAAGKTTRVIAAEVGVDQSTVVRSGDAKGKPSVLHRPAPAPTRIPPEAPPAPLRPMAPAPAIAAPSSPPPPPPPPSRLPGLAAIEEPGVRDWSLALEAMRAINELPPVAEMFERPDWLQQEAIEAEMDRAADWLCTFTTRFRDDRPAR